MNRHPALILVCLGLVTPAARSAEPEPAPATPADGHAPAPAEADRLHVEVGVDFTNAYYFRGLRSEDEGLIVQPCIEIGFDLVEYDHGALSAFVGNWNSFHSEPGHAHTSDDFVEHWHEAELYAGLALHHGHWRFETKYAVYTSPADAFKSMEEVELEVGYHDSAHWDDRFSINPHVELAIETTDRGGSEGVYLALGIAPSFGFDVGESLEVGVAFPVTVGLGLDEYYVDGDGNDEVFGYVDVGADVSVPLPAPSGYGRWTLRAGVHALILGDAAQDVNDGDDVEVIASIGFSIEF